MEKTQIVPSVIMKHAPKITKTVSESRLALKGAFHDTDGSITVTNSHYLWRVENAHAYPSPIIIDPVTMAQIEGNYPATKRLIPAFSEAKAVGEIALDKRTRDIIKALREAGRFETDGTKKKENVILKIHDGVFTTMPKALIQAKAELMKFDNPGVKLYINATYLLNTLEWLADELGERATVPFCYYGEMRPVLIGLDRAKAIIMPVRVNE